jgi:hypothetical protein
LTKRWSWRLLRISKAVLGLQTSPERRVRSGESVYGNGRGRWPLTDDERESSHEGPRSKYDEDGEEWVVEVVDYCEEEGRVAYYYPATKEGAPVAAPAACEWPGLREVVRWALGIELPPEAAPVAPVAAAPPPGGMAVAGKLNKLEVAKLNPELKKRGC